MTYHADLHTPVGWIRVTTTNSHIIGIEFLPDSSFREIPNDPPPILQEAMHQLQEYFSGKRFAFDLPLQLEGTPFQKKVWHALQTIPYGTTISYRQLAERVGNARAFRAVGNANRKNPIPIIIPCHRVIQTNGQLGGYSSGTKIKEQLLELEKKFAHHL